MCRVLYAVRSRLTLTHDRFCQPPPFADSLNTDAPPPRVREQDTTSGKSAKAIKTERLEAAAETQRVMRAERKREVRRDEKRRKEEAVAAVAAAKLAKEEEKSGKKGKKKKKEKKSKKNKKDVIVSPKSGTARSNRASVRHPLPRLRGGGGGAWWWWWCVMVVMRAGAWCVLHDWLADGGWWLVGWFMA